MRAHDTASTAASTSQPSTITVVPGVAHGEAGAQRCHSHGPPARPGTIAWVTERRNRSHVMTGSSVQRFWSTTARYTPIQAAVTSSSDSHSARPRCHTARTESPQTWASRAATAKATNGMTAAFSKNNSVPKYTSTAEIRWRRLPVRTNRIASPHTHASPACSGSEFSPAAHHAKAGTVSGVNKAKVKGINNTGRRPRMIVSVRSSAREASSCSTSRLSAGKAQLNGASRVMAPATRNAPGMTCPS